MDTLPPEPAGGQRKRYWRGELQGSPEQQLGEEDRCAWRCAASPARAWRAATSGARAARRYEEYVPLRKRRALAVESLAAEVRGRLPPVCSRAGQLPILTDTPSQAPAQDLPDDEADEAPETVAAAAKQSLLVAAARAKKGRPEETEADKLRKEEQAIMADITRKTALKGVKELARVRTLV